MSDEPTPALHPYATLTPEVVLDAIDACGLATDGRLLTLNSYENRVYQAWLDDGSRVIAKFYRPERWTDAAILEEHAFSAALAEAEIPAVAPKVLLGTSLHVFAGFRFSLTPHAAGRAPEFEREETLTWMGRFLGRIHAIGAREPFQFRHTINCETYGDAAVHFIERGGFVPDELRVAYFTIAKQALAAAHAAFSRVNDIRSIRVHGDCHAGNVLWNNGPTFVDFDDCATAPAIQDVWMLLSGDRADQQTQLGAVLDGYEDFAELDRRELALIEPLRTLRLLHMSAWIARRWQDPAFPRAFPWFGTQRYWQDRILELREQVALMSEPPLVA